MIVQVCSPEEFVACWIVTQAMGLFTLEHILFAVIICVQIMIA